MEAPPDNPNEYVRLKRFLPGLFETMVDWMTTHLAGVHLLGVRVCVFGRLIRRTETPDTRAFLFVSHLRFTLKGNSQRILQSAHLHKTFGISGEFFTRASSPYMRSTKFALFGRAG
jgi:hypothetical protein